MQINTFNASMNITKYSYTRQYDDSSGHNVEFALDGGQTAVFLGEFTELRL